MRISIIAIGRQKKGPEQEFFGTYLKRAIAQGRSLGISEITLKELPEASAQTAELRRQDEGRRILNLFSERAIIVALDEHGQNLTSAEFANTMRGWLDGNVAEVALTIGGPDGHSTEVLARAKLTLALGRMTWPHGLARTMLMEQIYRSVTILLNHPYHRA